MSKERKERGISKANKWDFIYDLHTHYPDDDEKFVQLVREMCRYEKNIKPKQR